MCYATTTLVKKHGIIEHSTPKIEEPMLSLLALLAVIASVFIAWEVLDFTIKKVLGHSKATTIENHS